MKDVPHVHITYLPKSARHDGGIGDLNSKHDGQRITDKTEEFETQREKLIEKVAMMMAINSP